MIKNFKVVYVGVCLLLVLSVIPTVSAYSTVFCGSLGVVYVDDDFNESTSGWGVTSFKTIQNAVDTVSDSTQILVYEGSYTPFIIQDKSDVILAPADNSIPLVTGNQQVKDITVPGLIRCIVFVTNSENIDISGFNFQGENLDGRSYAVLYNDSSGSINKCTVASNQRANMYNTNIRAQINTTLTVDSCLIEQYGRIGVYCRTGSTLFVYNSTLIGQKYSDADGDYVNYGIEIENLGYASYATIAYNELYNHHHTGAATWSSAAIIVDAWRYYEVTESMCTATIQYNDIHDNMFGVQIIPNENIHVNRNKIYDNIKYGAVSDPYWDGSEYVDVTLDARFNWWGDETGPLHESENPNGEGDKITDYVDFIPWLEGVVPQLTLIKPEPGFLYYNFQDAIELKFPFITTLILGDITIEVEAKEGLYGIEKVEFYIDDDLTSTDYTPPYSWRWDEKTPLLQYTIKVVGYDSQGTTSSAELKVWKLKFLQ